MHLHTLLRRKGSSEATEYEGNEVLLGWHLVTMAETHNTSWIIFYVTGASSFLRLFITSHLFLWDPVPAWRQIPWQRGPWFHSQTPPWRPWRSCPCLGWRPAAAWWCCWSTECWTGWASGWAGLCSRYGSHPWRKQKKTSFVMLHKLGGENKWQMMCDILKRQCTKVKYSN